MWVCIYLKDPLGAGDSPCQSALLFFSTISAAAAATGPVGRMAGQWQAPLTRSTGVFEKTEDSSGRLRTSRVTESRPSVSAWLINKQIPVICHRRRLWGSICYITHLLGNADLLLTHRAEYRCNISFTKITFPLFHWDQLQSIIWNRPEHQILQRSESRAESQPTGPQQTLLCVKV